MRVVAMVVLSLLVAAPATAAEGGLCPGPDGLAAVVEPGRDADLRGLFAPYEAGTDLPGVVGWRFDRIAVARSQFEAVAIGPGGVEAALVVRAARCAPGDPGNSPSFSFGARGAGEGAAARAVELLRMAARANDRGGFWRAFVEAPRGPPGAGTGGADPGGAPAAPPLHGSTTGLLLLLVLAATALVVALPALARAAGLRRAGGAWTFAALTLVTAAGAGLRLAAGPTFLREAYALPNVNWIVGGIQLGVPVLPYPQTPDLLAALIGPGLSGDPYGAWFATNLLLGALTIPLCYLVGAQLTGRRAGGLVAATLVACWPHHIVLSASEVTHVAVVFWATAALACGMLAARDGRMWIFAAALLTAAAASVMRPEAPALALPLALVALGHGDQVRRRLGSPLRWLLVALVGWLVVPTWVTTLADASAADFVPGAVADEGGLLTWLGGTAAALVMPDGRNAFFDVETTAPWLYPLAVWGAVGLWRSGPRLLAAGLGLWVVGYLALFNRIPAAVEIFEMSRYHASALPAVGALAAFGLWDLVRRLGSGRRALVAGLVVAGLGVAWWPAVAGLDLDWQQHHRWVLELGRQRPELSGDAARIVVPDNRRRFRDLFPRGDVAGLTAGRQDPRSAVTVEHAIAGLHLGDDRTEAYWFAGLPCWLAVLPGEPESPQCVAMRAVFELEPIETRVLDAGPFLTAYVATRVPPPVTLGLYRIGARKLGPEAGLRLLPRPRTPLENEDPAVPASSHTPRFDEAPVPPLGRSMAPYLHGVAAPRLPPDPSVP